MRAGEEDPVAGHRVKQRAAHPGVAISAEKSPDVVALHDQHIVASLLRQGPLLGQ
jgi:hypothetical protein